MATIPLGVDVRLTVILGPSHDNSENGWATDFISRPIVSFAQRIVLSASTFALMATTILVLAIRGYNPWIAVVGGVWFGLLPIGLFGLAIAVAPGRLIRWRERALAGQAGYQKVVGGWFSKRLAIDGAHPWESSEARKRVRMLGVVELVVWLAGVAVLLVLLARGG